MLFLCRHVSPYVSDDPTIAAQKSPPLQKHSVPTSVRGDNCFIPFDRKAVMNKFESFVKICILSLVFLSLILSAAADQEDKDAETQAQGPNAAERAIGLTLGPWNTIKSWINLAWLLLKPPNSNMDMETPASTGAMMKDAATKSFETSKSTAEDVAKAAGGAVHRTAEKVKRTVSHSERNPSANEDL